jgi:NADH-quinone oxidoreductase subunit M
MADMVIMMILQHLLSWMIWLPVIGAALCLCVSSDRNPIYARVVAVSTALLALLLCIPLYTQFNFTLPGMQFVEDVPWISAYNIHYALGVDGLSAPLVILTSFTTLIVILAACSSIHKKVGEYMASFLIMQAMVIGVFTSLDALLFYVFWEGMLIPMYLSIGIWGGERRSYASIKFFLYTFFGSALMLIVLLYLGLQAGNFMIANFYPLPLRMSVQIWIFLGFLLAFMVKVPMWPTHTWLPDAHTEAPAGGSVVLAALMLKIGTYGFLRFSLPIVPDASNKLANLMIALSLISIVYISLVAIVQRDMKRLIAYSSIAHMAFVTLASFAIYVIVRTTHDMQYAALALQGAMFQMIAHAFSSGAMFIGAGILFDRMHTHLIKAYGGVAHKMPILAAFFMLFALSNIGLPGTSGFVGEFMILLSLFKTSIWILSCAALAVILGAAYTLWMYRQVFLGPVNPNLEAISDVNWIEGINLTILGALFLLLGLYPQVALKFFQASTNHLLQLSVLSKL